MTGRSIGVVGLGRMGMRWLGAVETSGGRLAGTLDSRPSESLPDGSGRLAEHHFTDPGAFFEAGPYDLLIVATPAASHMDYLRAGLEAGIRRFVIEKPIANRLSSADRLAGLLEEAGARVVVNHTRRYAAPYRALGAATADLGLGDLRGIHVSMGAGGTATVGTHFFDLADHLFGATPGYVFGLATGDPEPNPRGAAFDDPGTLSVLAYPDGRRATIEVAGDTGIPPVIELRYAFGRVVIENESGPWRVLQRSAEDRDLPLARYGTPLVERFVEQLGGFDLVATLPDVIEDAWSDTAPICGFDDGVRALECFAAVRLSAERAQVVRPPVEAGDRDIAYEVA